MDGNDTTAAGTYRTSPGERYPLGVTIDQGGVNFSLFSRHADWVELILYDRADSPEPVQVIRLDPDIHRTFFCWHVRVEGLAPGIHYTWRADGPNDVRVSGFRFDPTRELLDPAAVAVTDALWDRRRAIGHGGTHAPSMRAMVLDDDYDWEGDRPLNRQLQDTIIYEMHVGGFTRHPSAKARHPGTFRGLIEKIPYLRELGITDVELLPVMAFDQQDVPERVAARGLKNYWGYSTHSFQSPHPGYCVSPLEGSHRTDFRDMVKALHRAGIGVILDVVFNHTAEGGADGPVINFKGFGNRGFYHLDPVDRSKYLDYTGCGNTVNCNHPLVGRFIIQCLEYWVREMHVDGFRFDLASAMARGEDGKPLQDPPVLWGIELSDVLARTRIIAEAWDAAGLYHLGSFPGYRWAEWNGRYRDTIRRFVRGDRGLISSVATNICGSSDLYQKSGRLPINSINFVTCHDGFTLWDLVSYGRKHNDGNGEENGDGLDENYSENCGREGETDDPKILARRRGQAKNFTAILLLSIGVPMLLSGDEVLRTQEGNNNCYCQDNGTSWFDWGLVEKNREMFRFVRQMIAFRKRHPILTRARFLTGRQEPGSRFPDIVWHGRQLSKPLWTDPTAQLLAYTMGATQDGEEDLHVVYNMSSRTLNLPLPPLEGRVWFRAIDTAAPSPRDIVEPPAQLPVAGPVITVSPRSIVVLESRPVAGR
jgi:glycogen operon protein